MGLLDLLTPIDVKRARQVSQQVTPTPVEDDERLQVRPPDVGLRSTNDLVRRSSAVYTAIDLRAEAVASVPPKVLSRQSGEQVSLMTGLAELLTQIGPAEGLYLTEADLCVHGNAFWYHDGLMLEVLDANKMVVDSRLGYRYDQKEIESERIIHFREGIRQPGSGTSYGVNSTQFYVGVSRLEAVRAAVETSVWSANSRKTTAKNSIDLSRSLVTIQEPMNGLTPLAEKLIKKLKSWGAGLDQAMGVLLGQAEVHQLGASQDPQFQDTQQWALQEIARGIGIPSMLIGDTSQSTYNNIYEARRIFWQLQIDPRLRRLEETMTAALCVDVYAGQEIRFDRTGIQELRAELRLPSLLEMYEAGLVEPEYMQQVADLPEVGIVARGQAE